MVLLHNPTHGMRRRRARSRVICGSGRFLRTFLSYLLHNDEIPKKDSRSSVFQETGFKVDFWLPLHRSATLTSQCCRSNDGIVHNKDHSQMTLQSAKTSVPVYRRIQIEARVKDALEAALSANMFANTSNERPRVVYSNTTCPSICAEGDRCRYGYRRDSSVNG
jgi:hypothetical protein